MPGCSAAVSVLLHFAQVPYTSPPSGFEIFVGVERRGMDARSIAMWTATLAALLLPAEHAAAQRAKNGVPREKSRVKTRPIEPLDQVAPPTDAGVRPAAAESPAENGLSPVSPKTSAGGGAKVTRGTGALPNEYGQVWRDYDISPFAERASALPHPEQAIIDWILRETGYEVWHSEPLGILSATPSTLRVYHTPEMQATVAGVVDRFVNPAEANHACGLRLISLSNPNWRSRAPAKLTPVEVQSAGVQAWLVAKEDAAILLAELRKRSDYTEYGSPQLLVPNGQPTVVSSLRTRTFTQHLLPGLVGIATYESKTADIEEGIAVELTPLVSRDGASIDALVKCNIDQVERIVPVAIETGTALLTTQRTKIDVPQRSQLRVKETFRWSVDEVLVISLGIVPSPTPRDENLLEKTLSLPTGGPDRAEVLLFVESRGGMAPIGATATGKTTRNGSNGRY
jgi:hypothetical protein